MGLPGTPDTPRQTTPTTPHPHTPTSGSRLGRPGAHDLAHCGGVRARVPAAAARPYLGRLRRCLYMLLLLLLYYFYYTIATRLHLLYFCYTTKILRILTIRSARRRISRAMSPISCRDEAATLSYCNCNTAKLVYVYLPILTVRSARTYPGCDPSRDVSDGDVEMEPPPCNTHAPTYTDAKLESLRTVLNKLHYLRRTSSFLTNHKYTIVLPILTVRTILTRLTGRRSLGRFTQYYSILYCIVL